MNINIQEIYFINVTFILFPLIPVSEYPVGLALLFPTIHNSQQFIFLCFLNVFFLFLPSKFTFHVSCSCSICLLTSLSCFLFLYLCTFIHQSMTWMVKLQIPYPAMSVLSIMPMILLLFTAVSKQHFLVTTPRSQSTVLGQIIQRDNTQEKSKRTI